MEFVYKKCQLVSSSPLYSQKRRSQLSPTATALLKFLNEVEQENKPMLLESLMTDDRSLYAI